VEVLYTCEVNLASDFGSTSPGRVTTLDFPGHVPNIIGGSSGSSGDVGGFTDMSVPIMAINLYSGRANFPFYHGEMDMLGGWVNTENITARM